MVILDSREAKIYEVSFIICACSLPLFLLWSCWTYVPVICIMYACLKKMRKGKRFMLESHEKTILITGCDTGLYVHTTSKVICGREKLRKKENIGFGHHLAKRLDDQGCIVFAGVLSENSEGAQALLARKSERLYVIQLDVTSEDDVINAAKVIKSYCGKEGLWGLVNNAGMFIYADIEFATIEQYKKCHDINLYGMIRVTKAFLPYIRKARGRVVNISSVKGRYGWPSDSIYHVSKHGIETWSDSLRMEMRKFGVNVAVVEPGYFDGATSMISPKQLKRLKEELEISWKTASEDVKTTYGREYIDKLYSDLSSDIIPESSPDPVLDAIEDALLNKTPRSRYIVFGPHPWFIDPFALLAITYDFLPTWLSDYIIARMSGCDEIKTKKWD